MVLRCPKPSLLGNNLTVLFVMLLLREEFQFKIIGVEYTPAPPIDSFVSY